MHEVDDELRDKGFVRELVSAIQGRRKQDDLDFVARIRLSIGGSERVKRIVEESAGFIQSEVLAVELSTSDRSAGEWTFEDLVIEGEAVALGMRPE